MYKRKTQKTNSIDVNILNKSKFKTNFKKKNIKIICNCRFFKTIEEII